MNDTLNPTQSDCRKGDFTVPTAVDFFLDAFEGLGRRSFLAKLGNNGGVKSAFLPVSAADISLYVIDDIEGYFPDGTQKAALETPDTGENLRLRARGTGSVGDKLILAQPQTTGAISGTSNANPDVITTSAPHGLLVGDTIQIAGVLGDLAVNGLFYVLTVPSSTTLTISATPGGAAIAGSGAYVSGGIYTAHVGDTGKVRSLTGSLAPTAPGQYFRAAIAEENFVDGQLVKCRWFPGMERIVSTFAASGVEATDIAALKAILEAQGLVA